MHIFLLMSKHVHFLIDKNKLVPTGDVLYTSLTESLARNERLISHFLQNGNNERVISLCENCLQQVDNLNQSVEENMSTNLSPISILSSGYCSLTSLLASYERNSV